MRVWPLGILGSSLAWLTFYPTVAVAAVIGGLPGGLLATFLACMTVTFLWPLLVAAPFIKGPADWLGMAVYCLTCTLISFVAEGKHRANMRAERAKETAETLAQTAEEREHFIKSMPMPYRVWSLIGIPACAAVLPTNATLNGLADRLNNSSAS